MADRPAIAVVTGAGRGMGRACLRAAGSWCELVIAVDRDVELLAAAVEEERSSGLAVEGHPADVADSEAVAALAQSVARRGRFRALAHAAGVSPTMADWRTILQVDLVGSALLLEAFSSLVEPGSAAVCFASMASQLLLPNGVPEDDAVLGSPLADDFPARLRRVVGPGLEDTGIAYAWAKRGVQLLAARTAVEWGPRGGRVCSLSPGMVDTPQGRQEAAQQPMMAMLEELTPLRRYARAEELAAVASFLLSDAASFVTGVDVLADGGVVAAVRSGAGSGTVPGDP